MTVYSSYHRVMKGLKESSDQNKHLSPWHSGFAVIVFNMFYFTSTAGFGAQQWPDAVTPLPAHLNQGLQQQQRNPVRTTKCSTRLVPCSAVTQADAPNLACEPHLRD